jgi:hypothetical protein
MTLSKLIEELQEIRSHYPEFADSRVEVDCGENFGIVTGVIADELEVAKVVLRGLTIRASESHGCLLDSVWKEASHSDGVAEEYDGDSGIVS